MLVEHLFYSFLRVMWGDNDHWMFSVKVINTQARPVKVEDPLGGFLDVHLLLCPV